VATQWRPGQSGNPAGKPKGAGRFAALRESIANHVPEIIERLAPQAKEGDGLAARLLLERVYPAMKAVEQAQSIELPSEGTLTDKGNAVLSAVAAGYLAPSQGAALIGAIGSLARVAEIDELASRVAALEKHHAQH
jgi:hypothetical protein